MISNGPSSLLQEQAMHSCYSGPNLSNPAAITPSYNLNSNLPGPSRSNVMESWQPMSVVPTNFSEHPKKKINTFERRGSSDSVCSMLSTDSASSLMSTGTPELRTDIQTLLKQRVTNLPPPPLWRPGSEEEATTQVNNDSPQEVSNGSNSSYLDSTTNISSSCSSFGNNDITAAASTWHRSRRHKTSWS